MDNIWVLVSLVIVFFLFSGILISIFNRFARNRNFVQDAWSNIDVALKKRYDLVPNLIETVKGYAQHETETLEKVIKARNDAMNIPKDDIQGKIAAENQLTQTLRSIFALSEAYPNLKTNTSFLELQNKLGELEETLERSRRYYNGTVRENNLYGESFPGILFANIFRYKHYDFFEVDEQTRQVVDVNFNKK